jgi:hypothetical protein
VASRLKSIISDGSIVIEPKGVNSYKKPNHLHLLFTSNEETTAIFIDPSPYERRFTVLKVSPHRAMDLDYWSFMHLWTPGRSRRSCDTSWITSTSGGLINRPIETDAKRDVQKVGVDPEVSWIISRMASGFPIGERVHNHWFEAFHAEHITEADKKNNVKRRDVWPSLVMANVVEADFKHYVREHGRPVYTGSVLTNIKRVLPEGSLKASSQGHGSIRRSPDRAGHTRPHPATRYASRARYSVTPAQTLWAGG